MLEEGHNQILEALNYSLWCWLDFCVFVMLRKVVFNEILMLLTQVKTDVGVEGGSSNEDMHG